LVFSTLAASGLFVARAQDNPKAEDVFQIPNCALFGPARDKFRFVPPAGATAMGSGQDHAMSALTAQVTRRLAYASTAVSDRQFADAESLGTIDKYIFGALQAASVTPAAASTDSEFIRRVTLDSLGRIPTADRLVAFLNDRAADKRAKLVEELLAKPEYVDKWTMFFGDLLKNNSANTQIRRYDSGRDAFYAYIKSSIAANKPYDQMAAS